MAKQSPSENPIEQFEIGPFKNFVYLIMDWTEKKAALVDPATDLSQIESSLKAQALDLTHILLTHTHHDHIGGLSEILALHPQAKLVVHSKDLHRLPKHIQSSPHLINGENGALIRIGNLAVEIIHTPGHSAGECCYFLDGTPPQLLTGDTLFIRDCGRTDFEDGSNEEMFSSLQKIKKLPKETLILPGHHYVKECTSTLEKELKENGPLKCRSVEELASLP